MTSQDAWGVVTEWVNANDQPEQLAPANLTRLRELVGAAPADLEERAPIVTRPGRDLGLGRVEVRCEDDDVLAVQDVSSELADLVLAVRERLV